ncbi:uncharacterized protein LOC129584312 [Paramacrobiotus metropolitanus]|uniref:uncharacterized protein LOC129584312 n=1 Tax=Paramacrobiotus metropolitanus TaxID=2943436 RepID=UPI00244641B7|nr:uncharacterized protein LOC129584312 [Paramacrobiotus metropolitanus]
MFGKGSLIILLLIAYCDYCVGCRKFYLTKDGDTIEAIAKDNPPLTFSQLRYLNPDVGLKNLSLKTNLCIDADDVAVKDNKLCKRYGPIDADIESVSDNFPWLVHIRAQDPAGDNGEMDSQYCTGTLLNARAVLTTRTCVTNDPNQGTMRPAANHGVALAVDKISGFGLPYVPVEKIFPGQHFKIAGDDIAILQLSQPVAATEFVHLPESREQVLCPDTAGSLVGWDPYATDTGVTVQRINGHIMESDKGCRGFI